jgi:hypothetical protein
MVTKKYYHAIVHYSEKKRYWWNHSRSDIIKNVILPFASQQVSLVTRFGVPSLFNFASASYVTILETEQKLVKDAKKGTPPELTSVEFVQKNEVTKQFTNEVRILASSPGNRSLIQRALLTPKKQIFVNMKYGDAALDSAYEGVMKPVGSEFGYDVFRISEVQDSGVIGLQILESISESEIILCELTGERPNCYFETGFAYALGKECIFSAKRGERVHFDLSGNRFLQWDTEAEFRTELRARLQAISDRRSA